MLLSSHFHRSPRGAKADRLIAPHLEELESRLAPAAPEVLSINRTPPALTNTSATSVQYTVTFDQAVTGVDAADFKLSTSGAFTGATSVVVAGSGAAYSVTVSGIQGSGDLRLDLIDDDSIKGAGVALGGAGAGNGSFQGQDYEISQWLPTVVSIQRAVPAGPVTNANSVQFTVTFSEAVTGVDPTDFQVVGAVATAPPQVAPLSAKSYVVTVGGITGTGTLGLNLVDDRSIHDLDGNTLISVNPLLSFASQAQFATGSQPSDMAVAETMTVADVNGDGAPDIVNANTNNASVSVLLGYGDGAFRDQQTFAVGTSPTSVAAADVNGDGILDLIIANRDSAAIGVLLGNGDGTFQGQQTFGTSPGPVAVRLGDVNGDGKVDLAIVHGDSDAVSVLSGAGNGTFQLLQTFAAVTRPGDVALRDVNADGKLDLAFTSENTVTNANATVSVLLGNGNGSFQARKTFAAGTSPWSFALGDLNGDGRVDLAIAATASSVSVLLGNGDGTFQAQQTFATAFAPTGTTIADINRDGKPDLVVANYFGRSAGVALGNGDGTFQAQQTFAAGHGARSAAVADLNGDEEPDIVVANGISNSVSVFLATGNGAGVGDFTGQTYAITSGASTTTTLTATPNASTGGTLVTFKAIVAPFPGNLGTVIFRDNAAILAANVPVVGGVATYQTSVLAPGTHAVSAEYSGATGFPSSASSTLNYVVSPSVTPQLVSVIPNANIVSLAGSQRSRVASLVVSFAQPVQLDAGAFTLVLHTKNVSYDGQPKPNGLGSNPAQTSLQLSTDDNAIWVITFQGDVDIGADGFGSLKDGVYDLKIDGAKVHLFGVPGASMPAKSVTTFHRLFGDNAAQSTSSGASNYEALVNTPDNLLFRVAFNRTKVGIGYLAYCDFNGDGFVGTADNLQFRTRINKALIWRV